MSNELEITLNSDNEELYMDIYKELANIVCTYYGNSDVKVECVNDSCKPKNYYCDTVKCEIDKKNNIYTANIRKYDNVTYTLPYEFIKDNLFGIESDNRVNTSIIKMIILSIIYNSGYSVI